MKKKKNYLITQSEPFKINTPGYLLFFWRRGGKRTPADEKVHGKGEAVSSLNSIRWNCRASSRPPSPSPLFYKKYDISNA